jgi:hypothetical protein
MTEEINYVLNLQLGDVSYSDLRKIEMSMMRIGEDLRRIFGDSDISNIIKSMERVINLTRQAQVMINAVELALIPGAGWVAGLYAATSVVGFGFSAYDSIQGM